MYTIDDDQSRTQGKERALNRTNMMIILFLQR